jgi:outer membrane protein assembly factor BamA
MVRGEAVSGDLLERDRLAVIEALLDHGFVEGGVSADLQLDRERAAIDVVFTVLEGNRYRLGEVRIDAAMKLPEARYAPARAPLQKGAWFNRSQIAAAVTEIERIHRDAGLPKRVRPEATVRGREIDVVFHLEDP